MRLNFTSKVWFGPQPVFVIGTYNEDGTANAMTCVWAGQVGEREIVLSLAKDHITTKNIRARGEFTISIATEEMVKQVDYVGISSLEYVKDKMDHVNFTEEHAQFVDAPVFKEFPVTMECKLFDYNEKTEIAIAGIVNMPIEKSVLAANGKPDPAKYKPLVYDSVNQNYMSMGGKVARAFSVGKELR